MSQDSTSTKDPFVSLLGSIILFAFPIALIVMLGIVGFAFMNGSGLKPVEEAEVAATTPPPAAPAAVAAPSDEDAPAAEATVEVAATDSAPAGGVDPEMMALGQASYAICAACHGPDGQGIKMGATMMAPSLTGSELLVGDPDAALLVILKGIAKEDMSYMGMMASLAAGLDDKKLAAVLTYSRNAFGNSAPPITVEQAAAARAKFADVDAPSGVSRKDIEEIVAAHR